jgi:hypothetical protein
MTQQRKKRIYIAAHDLVVAKGVKEMAEEDGFISCARWIDEADPDKFGKSHSYDYKEKVAQATTCVEDIVGCDILLHVASGGKGGRHVELGMALAMRKVVVHVGDPENAFHYHPDVRVIPNAFCPWFRQFLQAFK